MALLLTLPAVAHAQFTYTTKNGTITITGYTGTDTVVTIPNTIGGWPVTSIGAGAFRYNSLTSITIPSTVTNIGDSAFASCSNLTSVTIPNSVARIGDWAFGGCFSMTNMMIPNNVTSIGDFAFAGCRTLMAIAVDVLNPSYSSVDGVLFDKSQATLIQFPEGKAGSYAVYNGATTIRSNAFYYCTSMTNVMIGSNVTNIQNAAFQGCKGLTSVMIPNSVTSIGFLAFFDCGSLMAITVDALNPAYSSVDGVLFNASQTTLIQYPGGKAGSYTVLDGVTDIGDYAFADCLNLTKATIPDTVKTIGFSAFSFCTNLLAVTIPHSVTTIEGWAFNSCASLTNITLPESVTSLSYGVFQYCITLTNFTIPSTVTNIGDSAFASCSNLTSVTLPSSVTALGNWIFQNCTSLSDISIPNSVTNIGNWMFDSCTSLTTVTIPKNVTSIGRSAFTKCSSLKGVYFQGDACSFGPFIFAGAEYATVYYLPVATGWGLTYGGRPTALWQPQIQTNNASFGVRTNQFGFNITWASGQVVMVEASTNLASPIWSPLQTNTLTSDTLYFSDPWWTNYPARFYRLRSP